MHSNEEIFEVVVKIIKEECEPDSLNINLNSHFQEDLGLDSMGLLTLSAELENHYQMYLNENPDSPPQTVKEVIELIQGELKK
jgi:acyl carrier protein